MRNLKRLLCVALALVLVLSTVLWNAAFVGARADSYNQSLVNQFSDIKGHWASDGLTNLIGYGYMKGVGNSQAAPNDTLTTAQLVALLVRIMGGSEEADLSSYVDMDKGAWYYSEIAQGLNMGIIPNTNTNYINPRQEASREYAAYMLCRAFGLTVRAPLDDYSDADKVSSWAVSSMQAMVAADALVGTNGRYGRYLSPQETITRGEFAQMVYRLVHDFVQPTDSANIRKQTFDGGLLISRAGVTLKDCTIKGNLYIADAVGSGDITLENTTVTGNIYARGCGKRSLHLEDGTTANSVVLINPYCATRLVVDDESTINGVLVNNGIDEVILEGNVGNVTLNVSDVDLSFENATASTVIINSANSVIAVDKKSTIDTMSIASSSSGVKVESEGKINRLAQMANGATLDLDGTLDYLLIGAVSQLDLKLDSNISLGALDLHCSNSTIDVNSDVKSISVSAFSDNVKLNLGKSASVVAVGISSASTSLNVHNDAVVGSVSIDAPKYKGTINSDLSTLVVGAGAKGAEVTLGKDSDIVSMTVNAPDAKVILTSGATVTDLHAAGKNLEVSGQGALNRVNVATTAEGTKVTTGNTTVANAGALKVVAGGIEVPANKTYVTTSNGKDVVRNNDGTPDGDGNKLTGADAEVATVANFELTYAAAATAGDIYNGGSWSLSDLCTGVSLVKNATGNATYKLTGNVKKVENFTPVYDAIAGYGSGYYVPVIVSADSMAKETDWTATSSGVVYTKAQLSTGTSYPGKLILFVQLTPGTADKTAYVTFDRDGYGTAYSPVTVSIDYSEVTFDGAQDLTGEIISYPVNATKGDLTTNSAVSLEEFGNFVVSKSNIANTYTVTGTAAYVNTAVQGNIATPDSPAHHFVPIMVNTSGFKSGWKIVTGTGAAFTAANVSRGTGCTGNLVILAPLVAGYDSSFTLYMDRDGDGRTDMDGTFVLNCITVGLGPKQDNDQDIGIVPDGLTVTLSTQTWMATVADTKGVVAAQPAASRDTFVVNAIKAQMKAEGYTGITHTVANGGKVYNITGTKAGSIPYTFTWNADAGVITYVTVSYILPGSTETVTRSVPEGMTVQGLIGSLNPTNDLDFGTHYFIGSASAAKAVADASNVTVPVDGVIDFGYYKIAAGSELSIEDSAMGVGITATLTGVKTSTSPAGVYAKAGSTVTVSFEVEAGTCTKVSTTTFSAEDADLRFGGSTGLKPNVTGNAGITTVELVGKDALKIVTAADEVTALDFTATFVVPAGGTTCNMQIAVTEPSETGGGGGGGDTQETPSGDEDENPSDTEGGNEDEGPAAGDE